MYGGRRADTMTASCGQRPAGRAARQATVARKTPQRVGAVTGAHDPFHPRGRPGRAPSYGGF
jgi:hypothetical protein